MRGHGRPPRERSGSVSRSPSLAPTSGDAQTAFFTQPDIAERTSRPYLQGRVRARWGEGETQGELNVGGHYGWLAVGRGERALARAGGERLDAARFRGSSFAARRTPGRRLAGLGGGGIGQNFGLDSVPVTTNGRLGPAQRPSGRAAGRSAPDSRMDDPDDADLLIRRRSGCGTSPLEGHVELAAVARVVGGEVRWLRTRYAALAT